MDNITSLNDYLNTNGITYSVTDNNYTINDIVFYNDFIVNANQTFLLILVGGLMK